MDYRRLAILIGLVAFALLTARAQDNYEIQVYSSEMDPPGTTTLELHSNFTNLRSQLASEIHPDSRCHAP
jgi:hypothetical protein